MGLIRISLALIVVYGHFQLFVLNAQKVQINPYFFFGMNAGFAVMYFYIVSGFLISYVLSKKYKDSISLFYRNRFVRIFSLYWPVYLLIILVVLPGCMEKKSIFDRFLATVLLGSDWMVALAIPQGTKFPFPPFLNVSWTLDAELTFYLLAPWILRSLTGSVTLFAFSLVLRLSFQSVYGFSVWIYQFFPSTIMFFLLGHFVRIAYDRYVWPMWLGACLLAGSLVCSTKSITSGEWTSGWFYGAFLLFALSVPPIFRATKKIRWMNVLGDASFPVYLIHVTIMLFLPASLLKYLIDWLKASPFSSLTGELCFLTVGIFVIIISIGIVYLVERPCSFIMKCAVEGVCKKAGAYSHRFSLLMAEKNLTSRSTD